LRFFSNPNAEEVEPLEEGETRVEQSGRFIETGEVNPPGGKANSKERKKKKDGSTAPTGGFYTA
jgi:hypothetical protein